LFRILLTYDDPALRGEMTITIALTDATAAPISSPSTTALAKLAALAESADDRA
jgi:hypothetical protein